MKLGLRIKFIGLVLSPQSAICDAQKTNAPVDSVPTALHLKLTMTLLTPNRAPTELSAPFRPVMFGIGKVPGSSQNRSASRPASTILPMKNILTQDHHVPRTRHFTGRWKDILYFGRNKILST